jgi:hypothetical protein
MAAIAGAVDRRGRGRPYTSRRVNAEFNWWLLIVGLVVGGGLVWFVLMDSRRREVDIDERERPREAAWLSQRLADEGYQVSPEATDRLLVLHREYLEAPPPDDPVPEPAVPEPAVPEPARPVPPITEPVVPRPTSPDPGTRASEHAADDRVPVKRRARDIGQ